MMIRTGRRALMARRVATEVSIGKRVLVVTQNGKMEGRKWLASIGHSGAHKAAFMAEMTNAILRVLDEGKR